MAKIFSLHIVVKGAITILLIAKKETSWMKPKTGSLFEEQSINPENKGKLARVLNMHKIVFHRIRIH